jgi:hypothetical protein
MVNSVCLNSLRRRNLEGGVAHVFGAGRGSRPCEPALDVRSLYAKIGAVILNGAKKRSAERNGGKLCASTVAGLPLADPGVRRRSRHHATPRQAAPKSFDRAK